jgi:xylulokinase
LPYVSAAGERAPFFNPQATGNLYGLTDQHTASDIARALVEALSFIVKEALEATHTEPQRLSISGGGARSDFWCQVIADVTRVPTTRNVDSQVGAKGAQIYGAVVRGEYGGFPEAVSALITPGDSFQPDPESWEHYNERYKLFLRLRETLSPLWQETYATHD